MENLKKQAIDYFNNKNYKKSLEIFLLILKKEPRSTDILLFTTYNYMQVRNFEKALFYLEKITHLNKKIPQVFYNIGICHNMLGKTQDAVNNFKKAISLKSDFYESYVQLGQLLKKEKLFDEALNVYKLALKKVNQKDSINVNISEIYYLKKDYQLSKKFAQDAISLNGNNYLAMINIANCFIDEGDTDKGIVELENAKIINSSFPMIYNNLGLCYKILGNDENAEINYKKAIELNPNLHDAFFNLSHVQLAQNKFRNGWENYEHRWGTQKKFTSKLVFDKPKWDITQGFGRILIWGEQGIGEQLLFSTIFPDVISRFKKVIVCIEDKLVKLFEEKFTNLTIYPLSTKVNEKEFDYHLPICSLAKVFRNDVNSFSENNLNRGFNKIEKEVPSKLKCAISWKSSNQDLGDIKSLQLEDLKEILFLEKIDFFNIQYTNEDRDVDNFEKKNNVTIHKNKSLDTFNDLLGLSNFISTCDFVITVSNTNAHLSASLGKPTYLLLPKTRGKFWYWENDKEGKNLWYPSIKKFKQYVQGEWSKPVSDLKSFLLQKYY